jgi:hypothetical protein
MKAKVPWSARRIGLPLALALCLPGCGLLATGAPQAQDGNAGHQESFMRDIALPPDAGIRQEQSLILGEGEEWFGRVSASLALKPGEALRHFRESMGRLGWRASSVVQGKAAILSLVKGERAAVVEIEAGLLGGSEVRITVSPRMRDQEDGGQAKK